MYMFDAYATFIFKYYSNLLNGIAHSHRSVYIFKATENTAIKNKMKTTKKKWSIPEGFLYMYIINAESNYIHEPI